MSNLVNFRTDVVQLLIDDENTEEGLKEAIASVTVNPNITWAKFTLTDDEPNKNKQRVPFEEFENLISSGVHMPIKMAEATISDGHDGTSPIGTITHLKKFKNTIVGLAALWNSERPDDVQLIKEKFNKKEPLNLSWELTYADSREDESSGIKDLLDVNLKAATLVGIPAYAGRTQINAVASENKKGEETLDELEKTKQELSEIQTEKVNLEKRVSDMEAEASDNLKELEELRAFKAEIEAEQAKAARLATIKEKFSEAGITKEDTYFEEKGEILLGFDDNSLDFFIQEAVAFAAKEDDEDDTDEGNASVNKVPNFVAEKEDKNYNTKELAKFLRESK